jgi:hypothetical protein
MSSTYATSSRALLWHRAFIGVVSVAPQLIKRTRSELESWVGKTAPGGGLAHGVSAAAGRRLPVHSDEGLARRLWQEFVEFITAAAQPPATADHVAIAELVRWEMPLLAGRSCEVLVYNAAST